MLSRKRLVAGVALLVLCFSPVAEAGGVLFFTEVFNPTFNDGTLKRINTDGTGLLTLNDEGDGLRGVAVDAAAGKVYWTNVNTDVIRRANLDGSEPEDLVTTGLSFPYGIDLDPANNKLYWGDSLLNQIGRADLDGSGPGRLLTTPFYSSVVVEASAGKLYWSTSITSGTGDIKRSNLDGSVVETLVTGVDKPHKLAVDAAGGKMYWTDVAVNAVRRSNLDGTDVEDLFLGGSFLDPHGLALDLTDGKVYWGQEAGGGNDSIMRMNLDGTDPEVLASGFGNIVEIAFAVPEVPECFLVIGDVPGASPFVGSSHEFETQVGPVVEDSYPVLMQDIPQFVLPALSLSGVAAARRASGSAHVAPPTPAWLLDGQCTVQVLMWNPEVFPGQPEQSSAGLAVQVLPSGQVITTPYGTPQGGLDIWAEVDTNAQGKKVIRFPFSIEGM